eukprot:CAMPEP_0175155618 /NCGR_PEP_ID=MMETSP0087-20121206/21092_1 /TAXON_ID=136419 /ORGANISM="Unknown Unknown, Strain D1" /LENGTH=669 /DNA_ID=CAMNT_0016442827 /DNA_START=56 /DNA_END=2065 /DNA_ORIENTATION=+
MLRLILGFALCFVVPAVTTVAPTASPTVAPTASPTTKPPTPISPALKSCRGDLDLLKNLSYVNYDVSKTMVAANANVIANLVIPFLNKAKNLSDWVPGGVNEYTRCMSISQATHCTINIQSLVEGVCVPKSCETVLPDKIDGTFCGDHRQQSLTAGNIGMLVVCTFFLLAVALGTYLDSREVTKKKDGGLNFPLLADGGASVESPQDSSSVDVRHLVQPSSTPKQSLMLKAVLCFSLARNWKLLTERSPTRKYKALDGLRSFSLFWVICGHTLNFQIFVGFELESFISLFGHYCGTWYLVLFTYGANLGVDTFFFLSGFLSTLVMLRRLQKGGKLPVHLVVLHRYLRLTPTLLFMIGCFYHLTGPFVAGPFAYKMAEDTAACGTYWGSNIAYINNFYPAKYSDTCMPWTWYLANDMQFFILGIVVLILYFKNMKAGIAAMLSLLVASIVITGVIQQDNSLEAITANSTTNELMKNQIYDKPYTRMGPYIVGMLTLVVFEQGWWNVVSKWAVVMAKLITFGMLLGVALAPMDDLHAHGILPASWGNTANFLNITFGRPAWAVAVACLTLLCVTGQGGWVDKFLSFWFWDPIGKLTYSAYLVHPILMRVVYYNSTSLFVFTPLTYFIYFLAFLLMTYSTATVAFVCVESPLGELEKLLTTPKRRPKTAEQK